jgi:hypothetical protein
MAFIIFIVHISRVGIDKIWKILCSVERILYGHLKFLKNLLVSLIFFVAALCIHNSKLQKVKNPRGIHLYPLLQPKKLKEPAWSCHMITS